MLGLGGIGDMCEGLVWRVGPSWGRGWVGDGCESRDFAIQKKIMKLQLIFFYL